MNNSVLQDWVMALPRRHQGVLVAAIRGADGTGKYDISRDMTKIVRNTVLVPADPRELDYPKSFMYVDWKDPVRLQDKFHIFMQNIDEYPFHFVMHLMHAFQVIGYKHPDLNKRNICFKFYTSIVHHMHLDTEYEAIMDDRLIKDRVAANEVVEHYGTGS